MYLDQVLLYVHLLAAIAWMGAGITLVLLARRAVQTGEEMAMIGQMEWLGGRVGGPSVILLLVTGVWMVARIGAWQFGQLWVILGLGGLVVLFLMGVAVHRPHYKQIRRAIEQYGEGSPEVQRQVRWSFRAGQVEVVVMAIVVLLMVFKPGL